MADATEQVQALLDELVAAGRPSSRTLPLPAGRANFADMIASVTAIDALADISQVDVEVGDHEVPVRLYRPDPPASSSGLVVFFHGGGWVFGDLDTHDGICRALVRRSGVAVASVHYRRAPEHPYPAALDDACGVLRWAAANASDLGIDPTRLAVAGDSSGGNLAAAVALRLRDEGDLSLRHQFLLYPALDPAMDTESYRRNADDPFLSADELEWYWDQYAAGELRDQPYAGVSTAVSLAGLPAAYVMVAGLDPLHDEGVTYAERLREAGVPVVLSDHDHMPHGFLLFGGKLTEAVTGLDEVGDAISAALL
jgi:acetyl esterase